LIEKAQNFLIFQKKATFTQKRHFSDFCIFKAKNRNFGKKAKNSPPGGWRPSKPESGDFCAFCPFLGFGLDFDI
jgi:hypothetical protein